MMFFRFKNVIEAATMKVIKQTEILLKISLMKNHSCVDFCMKLLQKKNANFYETCTKLKLFGRHGKPEKLSTSSNIWLSLRTRLCRMSRNDLSDCEN